MASSEDLNATGNGNNSGSKTGKFLRRILGLGNGDASKAPITETTKEEPQPPTAEAPQEPKVEETRAKEAKAPEAQSESLGTVFAPKPGTRRVSRPNPLGG